MSKDCNFKLKKAKSTKLGLKKEKLMKKYGKIVEKFPDPDEIDGNLLCDLLGGVEIGKPLLDQVVSERNNKNYSNTYLIFSGNKKNL
jgi:hypothetical protein